MYDHTSGSNKQPMKLQIKHPTTVTAYLCLQYVNLLFFFHRLRFAYR